MRFDTTVPQQALFLMNSKFSIQQARRLLNQEVVQQATSDTERLRVIWRLTYQRDPEDDELAWGLKFIKTAATAEATRERWEELAQTLLLSNETFFVD